MYKRIQIKLTTLHNNKRNRELLQGCADYNTILASQMLPIYQSFNIFEYLIFFVNMVLTCHLEGEEGAQRKTGKLLQ